MSSPVASPLRTRRFHTSISGVVSAVLLYLAIQSLVVAAQQPLRSWIISAINTLIDLGRFDILRIPGIDILWMAAAFNLLAGIVYLVICLAIANWVYRKARS
jgi:hypothetical protein